MQAEDEARAAIAAAGTLPDSELDLAGVALQLARIDAPEADWHAAAAQLSALARGAAQAAAADALPERAEALTALLGDYRGDSLTYDAPENANLIQVLARRRGLPVALGILWLHAAEAAGWAAHGVDFPGHFLVGLAAPRGQMLLDVFHGGTSLGPPALRALLKRVEGEQAELRPGLLAPMGKREVLLRLQNNLKLRRLRAGQLPEALACTEDMLRLAPGHTGLWREAAIMHQRLGQVGAALQALERCLALEPSGPGADRLRQVMAELRQQLN
jgi:regulator of sirC expression with transglutaminase-like and TPR domain